MAQLEFLSALQDVSRQAFNITRWPLQLLCDQEKLALYFWYERRTGRRREEAEFSTDLGETTDLILPLMIEIHFGRWGSTDDILRPVASRFRDRLMDLELVEELRLPMALNRLYIWPPMNWLDKGSLDKLELLQGEFNFSIVSGDISSDSHIRLAHPHLSDAIYKSICGVSNPRIYAKDISAAFLKALNSDWSIVVQILEVIAEDHPRLDIVDRKTLSCEIANAWNSSSAKLRLNQPGQRMIIWSLWASWATREPEIVHYLGGRSPFDRSIEALTDALNHDSWPLIWLKLWRIHPKHPKLLEVAISWFMTGNRDIFKSAYWPLVFKHLPQSLSFSRLYRERLLDAALGGGDFRMRDLDKDSK